MIGLDLIIEHLLILDPGVATAVRQVVMHDVPSLPVILDAASSLNLIIHLEALIFLEAHARVHFLLSVRIL